LAAYLFRLGEFGSDQIGDPVGDDLCFSGPGTGDYQKRTRSMGYSFFLDRVQGFQ